MNLRLPALDRVRFVGLAVLAVLLAACGQQEAAPEKEVIRPVKLMTISGDGSRIAREYPGTLSAAQSVELGFEVPGKIAELPVSDGQTVDKGELLARLDASDYIAARDLAEANRKAAQSAYERAKRIFDQGAGSQAEVDKALRDIDVARQELKRAQKGVDDSTLRAPFSGRVSRKIADNFQNVQAKQPVLLMEDIANLEMDIAVPEQDFVRMTPGLTLAERTERTRPEIVVSTFPGRSFAARLKSFETAADPVTRTYRATFSFDNPADVNLLPGMTAKARLSLPREDYSNGDEAPGMLIPAAAVVTGSDGSSYVWRYDETSSQVTRATVKLGNLNGTQVVITEGLAGGDRIAVAGAAHLRDGMKVRAMDQ